MARPSFVWRGESYRLDTSTWHFWGHARLIQLPGQGGEFQMTPDDTLFIQFAVKVGFTPQEDPDYLAQLDDDCQAYLEQNGHQVWTARDALQIVYEDSDTELAACLLDRLIYWFFVIKL